MSRKFWVLWGGAGLIACAGVATTEVPPAPQARAQAFVETLHGIEVHDPYRWMEDDTPERQQWIEAQSRRAHAVFSAIPGRAQLAQALRDADRGVTRVGLIALTGDAPRIFLAKRPPDGNVSSIWVRDGWGGTDRLLVDPQQRDSASVHHAVDFSEASPDGRYLAYGISASGSEDSVIEILEVDTGRVLPERIDRAQYASISWRPDSRSFFYWRRAKPQPGAKPEDWFKDSATYLHKLGDDPERAIPVFGATVKTLGLPEASFSWIQASRGSRWALGGSTVGTSADLEYFVAPLAKVVPGRKIPWRRITGPQDHVKGVLAHGDRLYVFSYDGAPRYRILEMDARSGTLKDARVLVPESSVVVQGWAEARDGLYVQLLDAGISRLERVAWDGSVREPVPLPFKGTLSDLIATPDRSGVRLGMTGWTTPRTLYAYEQGALRDLKLIEPWPIDYSHLTSEEVEVTSADGTAVPLSIVSRRDSRRDGSAPAMLNGYAGYGVVEEPAFIPLSLAWVDRGGVYGECHARGGGERGEQWHLDGIKQNKERGIEDLIACARFLIDKGYTAASHLTVTGTSNGGIVAGGAVTRAPELFAAALLRVPIVNLSRFEGTPGGPANVPEYGTAANADDFRAMLAADAYQRVKPGVRYPAVVLTGGMHDPRVPVWMPAKFAAQLQANSTGGPVLLRVESDAGHGIGSTRDQRLEEWTDLYAFALQQSGVPIAP